MKMTPFRFGWLRSKLGGCMYCMRTSFKAALSSWVILALAAILVRWEPLLAILLICAISLSGLWVAHLVIYSTKAIRRKLHLECDSGRPTNTGFMPISRRDTIPLFIRVLVGVAAATALPAMAMADNCHNSEEAEQCTGVYICCPTDDGSCDCGCYTGNSAPAC